MALKRAMPALVVLAIAVSLLVPLAYSKPGWAREGNWARYRFEIRMSSPLLAVVAGTGNITVKGVLKATITSVDDSGFRVSYKLESYEVEPKSAGSSQLIQQSIGEMEKTEYVSFDTGFSEENMPIYVNPSKLPSDGRFAGSKGPMSYEVVYDKSTGWVRHAHMKGSQQGVTIEMSVDLIDSNFIGGASASTSRTVVLAVAAAGAALAVAVAAVILVRRGR